MRRASRQRGNVFAMLFAGVALAGVLAATSMNTLQGPTASIVRVNQKAKADAFMMLNAGILLRAAADTDADFFNEAPAIKAAGALPAPAGGGLLPDTLGLSLSDPWGTAYGYCTYDHGSTNASGGRLTGDNSPSASTQPLIAIIAAGPDKAFDTSCVAYGGGPVSVSKSAGSDDVIFLYSYAQAAAAAGGLWTLNASDANKAELKDNGGTVAVSVDRSGGIVNASAISTAMVSAPASASDTLSIAGGLLLDTSGGTANTCGAGQTGALRLDAVKAGLELCNGVTFAPLRATAIPAGASGELQFNDGGNLAALPLTWTAASEVLQLNGRTSRLNRFTTDANPPYLLFMKRRGTATAPTDAASGDVLGALTFTTGFAGGAGVGTSYTSANAAIYAQITGAATDTLTQETAIRFSTKPNGATSASERLRITGGGNIGIGTAAPKSALHVAGAVQVSDDAAACDADKLGAVRFNADALGVCNSGGWQTVQTRGTWGRVTGGVSPSIAYGQNLAGVVRNSLGDYTVSYTTAQPSTNYVVMLSTLSTAAAGIFCQNYSISTASVRVRCFNLGGYTDATFYLQVVGP